MDRHLTSIDHVVIAVRDLDAAATTYAALLGRRPSWHGTHPGFGTANVLFRLDNTYLELLSPHGDGPLGQVVGAHLAERGEGPFALAFGSSDAALSRRSLQEAGLSAGDLADGEGRDGERVRRWKMFFVDGADTRGVPLFVVQHLSGTEALPTAEPSADPAAVASGVDHFVIMTPDPDGARKLYGDALGLRLALDRTFAERGVRLLFFRIGGLTLECAAALGPPAAEPPGAGDRLWGISYRVGDVARARDRVAAAGFDVSEVRTGNKPATRVCTVRRETHGVATLFLGPE
jgi:catechol 2,3-dioxygenase-like lactoylglutathione lyase family enzyme